MAVEAGGGAELAYRGAAEAHPRLDRFDCRVDCPEHSGDVVAPHGSLLCGGHPLGLGECAVVVGVAYVVEVQPVDVVAGGQFGGDACQVLARAAPRRVEVELPLVAHDQSAPGPVDGRQRLPWHFALPAEGDADHPCVALHAPLVAFVDGKGQRVEVHRLEQAVARLYG